MSEEQKVISKHEFYFETSLYEFVYSNNPKKDFLMGAVDAYNSVDGFDTTYDIIEGSIYECGNCLRGISEVVLNCRRRNNTSFRFFVIVTSDGLMKIGQHPSLADIQFAEIGKKYNKYLSKIDLKNYKKAIGLNAHGVGAGSFVYLRRIFENLIFETFESHKQEIKTKEVDFRLKRMEDKIDDLKTFLPSQLLEMKGIYGILSKGVHELSEEECSEYFSPIKLSIELILDQKIEQEQKIEKDKLAKKELQAIQQRLGNKNDTEEIKE